MKDSSAKRLDQSRRPIEAARRDLAAGDPRFAVDRAYYAMFYAAKALLTRRGLERSNHGAVHGAYGKEFAKTKDLDPKFHGWLLDAFEERQPAIYGIDPMITADRVREMISQAEEFLAAAREYLGRE